MSDQERKPCNHLPGFAKGDCIPVNNWQVSSHFRRPFGRQIGPLLLLTLLLSGCNTTATMLEPQGSGAAEITRLWWILFWMALAVFAFVLGFLLIGLFRRRPINQASTLSPATAHRRGNRMVVTAGIIGPAIILLVVFGLTLATLSALRTPAIAEESTIHVIGRRWWWEVQYPAYQFATANEIHIPVGEPVRIVLTSPNVIHSFWVPELQGKMDLIPGETNTLWLDAERPGVYRGQCAEFCGVQHAKMDFLVVAQPREEFDAWVAQQQRPAGTPSDPLALAGREVFLNANCIECHAIKGASATGNLGPDLTHLASRRTLASASIENNIGNLAGWITDPQHVKPGNLMPASSLTSVELQALLAYLATLE